MLNSVTYPFKLFQRKDDHEEAYDINAAEEDFDGDDFYDDEEEGILHDDEC